MNGRGGGRNVKHVSTLRVKVNGWYCSTVMLCYGQAAQSRSQQVLTLWQILMEFISWSWSSHTTDACPWDKVMMQTILYVHINWHSWWNWDCNAFLRLQMWHYSIERWSRIWKWPTTPLEANSTLGKTPVMSPSSEIGQDCWRGTLIQIHTFRHSQQKRCWWQTTSAKKRDWWFFLKECTR